MTNSNPRKHIVLYADDDPDDLRLVQEAFEKYTDDVEIVATRDGDEAILFLESLSPFDPTPCLIILDVNMPRMDGKEALQRIRSLTSFEEVPIILFTTSTLPADRDFARRHNAGFISKPLDARQMEAIADRFVEHCTDEVRKSIKRK